MNPILTSYLKRPWLVEPDRFAALAHHVLAYLKCYTREEVLAKHRADLELARDLPNQAVRSSGVDVPDGFRDLVDNGKMTVNEARTLNVHIPGYEEKVFVQLESPHAATKSIRAVKGKVGVIVIQGPIDHHNSSELMKAGGTSVDFISRAMDSLLGNKEVGAIVLDIDSPGGSVFGVQELADKIYSSRGTKPIYAHANALAASAAYWIASAADTFVMTPSGEVGSVGVYVMHVDQSAAAEMDGVKVTFIHAGKYKVEYSPFAPLSEDARDNAQAMVDAIYSDFIGALARNRGVGIDRVRKDFGKGRVMKAADALEAGMVDRVMSMEELMSRLTGGGVDAGAKAKMEQLAVSRGR